MIWVRTRDRQRVVEHTGGFLKRNSMFMEVMFSLGGIPFEVHVSDSMRTSPFRSNYELDGLVRGTFPEKFLYMVRIPIDSTSYYIEYLLQGP